MRYLLLIAAVWLWLVDPVGAAPALVQKSTGATATSTTTLTTNALGATPTQGNLLVVFLASNGGTITAPTGFTVALNVYDTTDDDRTMVAYKIAGAAEATTFQFTGLDAAGTTHRAGSLEYSGIDTSTPLDVTATQTETVGVTSKTSGTTATTARNDAVSIAVFTVRADISAISYTNSFVEQYDLGPSPEVLLADKIETATGTKESTASWTTAGTAIAGIAVFNGAFPIVIGCRLLQDGTSKRLMMTGTPDARILQGGAVSACIQQGNAFPFYIDPFYPMIVR